LTVEWFKPRGYAHFDAPVGSPFAQKVLDRVFVAKHSWLPLIHYTKRTKRCRASTGKTVFKDRPIMYASHRDACILSKYAWELTTALDAHYETLGLGRHVIAYRKLGRANYHFSADAFHFARAKPISVVLCYDITGFFDNLDHRILKERLKRGLQVGELAQDWFAVFRHVTQYKTIERDELAAHPKFGPRLSIKMREPLATIAELIAERVHIRRNPKRVGIPQGTPISSVFSNLYMIDIDEAMVRLCKERGALYQRYSDDILVVCNPEDEVFINSTMETLIKNHLLEIKPEKTERIVFDQLTPHTFQYLGFDISPDGAVIRPGSLGRQWRKAKRSIARITKIGLIAVAEGKATKIYTKKLRRRFLPVGVRNFSSYARRSAEAFGNKKIVRQVLRLERMIDAALVDLEPRTDQPINSCSQLHGLSSTPSIRSDLQ
jgi:RNA-directed DNA polymerase